MSRLDFAAKVRWRMRFDRNPRLVTLQDKYAVRAYARSKGVKTAELLHVTDRPETIPFEKLPTKYLIKANHGCGWNILCFDSAFYRFGNGSGLVNRDGSLLNTQAAAKFKLSQAEALQLCREWLARTYARREWAYRRIRPRIIVEELLEPEDHAALRDYRMYTFRGVVKAINVGSALYRNTHENVFFDPDWKYFQLTRNQEQCPDPLPERPARLGEMIAVAQTLGADIDFVRVDLYDTTRGVVLGEATIYPDAGNFDTPTACPVFNAWLGDQWKFTNRDAINGAWWNLACQARRYRHRVIRGLLGRRRRCEPGRGFARV